MHVTEEDLVLHYYGELAGSDEPRVAAHLQHCPDCHGAYRRLQQVLLSVTEASVSVPELPDGFERVVWARLEPGLASEQRSWWARILPTPARLVWGAAAALLVLGAFLAGRMTPRAPQPAVVAAGDQVRERILLVDLGDHLDRSQRVLVELVSADRDNAGDFTGERERAEELVSANRLYRQTAATTGDAAVVELLDQLERVLVEVAAASSGELSTRELEDVQLRIQSGSLLFKVRVVSSGLEERRKAAVRRTGQGSSL
jgi:hypothetical protein